MHFAHLNNSVFQTFPLELIIGLMESHYLLSLPCFVFVFYLLLLFFWLLEKKIATELQPVDKVQQANLKR